MKQAKTIFSILEIVSMVTLVPLLVNKSTFIDFPLFHLQALTNTVSHRLMFLPPATAKSYTNKLLAMSKHPELIYACMV